MASQLPPKESNPNRPNSERLDSWKEIATYLRRDLRTVQRWEEREGLPVHRHLHGKLGSVYAFRQELDAWFASREPEAKPATKAAQETSDFAGFDSAPLIPPVKTTQRSVTIYFATAILVLVLASGGFLVWRRFPRRRPVIISQAETLAVLPFEDISPDHSEGYVADGLTDDLITDLGQTAQLSVISRTSVMEFKGKNEPLGKMAQALHADLIIEGTILRSGDRVRITAQLIDASNDHHLWADRYEGDSRDVLTLQDDVAGNIVAAVEEKLTGNVATRQPPRPVNPEARVAYLTGRFYWNKRDEVGLKEAITYFEQAIAKDSDYAAAYSGLADCYNLLSVWGSLTPNEAFPKAREDALKAIQLDPNSAEAYTSLAFETYRYQWDFAGAEKDFQKAIALNPNYVTAHQWYGEFLGDIRRFDQGIAELRKAQQLDPLSPIVGCDLAACYIHAGRNQEAVTVLQPILAREPDFAVAHAYLAAAYQYEGDYSDSKKEHALYVRFSGDNEEDPVARINREWASGKREQARREIEALLVNTKEGRFGYVQMAQMYASVGDKDKAFVCLKKAYEEHSWWLVTMEVEPAFDPPRSDPRFQQLEH
ncbi:MAG: tetratricopeptide repeat protein, partial [Candidatus Acidiferrales bacterium]